MIFLLLLLLTGSLWAADCTPFEVSLRPDTLKGCGSDMRLYKERHVRINFPDSISKDMNPGGNGACRQGTDCNAFMFLLKRRAGPTQCWPLFYPPNEVSGRWSQRVSNQQAFANSRQCSGSIYAFEYDIVCKEDPTLGEKIFRADWDCPVMNQKPPPPIVYFPVPVPTPCLFTFLPGFDPCEDPSDGFR